jgi:diaminopimelate decarboxylase
VQDVVNTGAQGYTFIKLDSGMSEIMRPSLYGAQHPIVNLSRPLETQVKDFVVVRSIKDVKRAV